MTELEQALALTPALFPIETSQDGGRVRLVGLDEAAYAAASFLDARLIAPGMESVWTDWPTLERAAHGLPLRAHFIFHAGHVGSTLLSRLLGEHPGLFSLREPALLREVVAGPLGARRDPLLALFSRTWRAGQTALIKATSFVSEIAPALLAGTVGSRAILLTTTPPVYLRSILGGEASRQEAQVLGPVRLQRLELRLRSRLRVETAGEQIAMNWLCEAATLSALADGFPGRCLWLDFDRLLAEPVALLAAALRHVRADPGALDLAALAGGPLMRRYAKGPEHAYDAALRRRVQDAAAQTFGEEIRRGMAWLQRVAQAHPPARGALQRAAAAARAPLAAGPPAA